MVRSQSRLGYDCSSPPSGRASRSVVPRRGCRTPCEWRRASRRSRWPRSIGWSPPGCSSAASWRTPATAAAPTSGGGWTSVASPWRPAVAAPRPSNPAPRRRGRPRPPSPAAVRLRPSLTPTGRPAKHPVPSRPPCSAAAMLERQRWRRLTWRNGTKGPLGARFAALRGRVADGPRGADAPRLPGAEVWLIGEWRESGERKYYLSNLPPRTSLRRLAAAVKARWSCEQAHQHLKQELGLGDFEGRSWTGLHR